MRTITIALGQFLPEDDPKRNAVTMCRVLCDASAHGAELVLFPECCLTGYSVEHAASLAVDRTSDPVRAVEEACRAGAVTACFGYIERTDDGLTITQELFDGGNATIYRKTHLGAREAAVFRAGNVFPVAESPLKTGMQLCWESHIPEISALERSRGAQLLLMPYASAMSGEQCRRRWMVHLPARASDNGAFVAACNLPFPAKNGEPRGGGMAVFDPKGECIASYYGTEEHLLLCTLSGPLPRELPPGDMHHISYFDRKRTELF
jgi:predicted amidohydrolase